MDKKMVPIQWGLTEKDFDGMFENVEGSDERQCVTIWLPKGYKAKYDLIQAQTKSKFSRLTKKLLMQAIDLALEKKDSKRESEKEIGA